MTLSTEDNELMCRVEKGAPMGAMLRGNYWFPAALSQKLIADGAPLRVRLLGENYVAFRATDGRVGFFDEACPHRRASLALARNEDNALRCIFHGWKYGVDGSVVEVPTEPHNRTEFCKRVPLNHYPVREAAGIVWVWLSKSEPAPFPHFEFNKLPADQVYVVRQDCRYNWVQDVEGGMDSAHIAILHSSWIGGFGNVAQAAKNTAPIYEFQDRPGGFRYAAIRTLQDSTAYVRVNEYVAPWYSFICPEQVPDGDRTALISVPVDDANTVHWMVRYNPTTPLGPSFINPVEDPGNWPPAPPGTASNSWGQDREAMKGKSFTGFHHVIIEDFVVAESQGTIADRSKEYLNAGDRAVIRVRNILLASVRQFMKGETPAAAKHEHIPYPKIRAVGDIVSQPFDWRNIA